MIETLCTTSTPGKGQCHKRVAHLVVGHDLALLRVEQPISLLQSRHDPFDGVVEVSHCYGIAAAPGRKEGRLVDQIGKVGAGEAGRQGGDLFRIHIRPELGLLHIHFENLDTPLLVGPVDQNLSVEAAGAQQCRVEDLRAVRGGEK